MRTACRRRVELPSKLCTDASLRLAVPTSPPGFSRGDPPSRAEAVGFKPAEFFRTPEELLDRAYNRPTVEQLQAQAAVPAGKGEALLRKAGQGKPPAGYRELVARTNRLKTLEAALEATEAEKASMGKGRKRKVAPAHNVRVGTVGLDGSVEGGGARVKRPAAFRWKAERKR